MNTASLRVVDGPRAIQMAARPFWLHPIAFGHGMLGERANSPYHNGVSNHNSWQHVQLLTVEVSAVLGPHSESRIGEFVALAILVAIAGVLISPAVPSAPTLLPVSALLLFGLINLCSHAAVRARWPVRTLLCSVERIARGAAQGFVTAGLPLRR